MIPVKSAGRGERYTESKFRRKLRAPCLAGARLSRSRYDGSAPIRHVRLRETLSGAASCVHNIDWTTRATAPVSAAVRCRGAGPDDASGLDPGAPCAACASRTPVDSLGVTWRELSGAVGRCVPIRAYGRGAGHRARVGGLCDERDWRVLGRPAAAAKHCRPVALSRDGSERLCATSDQHAG